MLSLGGLPLCSLVLVKMGLQEDFDAAAADAASGAGNMPKITNDQKLELYALFKQVQTLSPHFHTNANKRYQHLVFAATVFKHPACLSDFSTTLESGL